MAKSELLLSQLKRAGFRLTAARRAIVESLCQVKYPVATTELWQKIDRVPSRPDLSTVYRELERLVQAGIVRPIQLQDRLRKYELAQLAHHHHVVCINCQTVRDIVGVDNPEKAHDRVAKQSGFAVSHHSLEFFGLCQRCQAKAG